MEASAEAGTSVTTRIVAANQAVQLPDSARGAKAPDELKTAECILWPGGYRGPCIFEPLGRGSFSVRREAEDEAFFEDVHELKVMVYAAGKADVRSFDQTGESILWGEAERSEGYPACWIGNEFSVCAY